MALFFGGAISAKEGNPVLPESNNLDTLLLEAVNALHLESFDVVHNKLKTVIEKAEDIEDFRLQVLGHINLGNLYFYYSADQEALNYFLTSLDLALQSQTDELLNTIYNNIGIIYSSNKNFEKAEEYFTKALELSRNRNEPKRIGINLINLGILKEEEKNIDQANDYYQQAFQIFKDQKDTVNLSVVINNIGNVLFQKEHYNEARKYYDQALQLTEGDRDNHYQPTFRMNYGKTLYKVHQLDSALFFLHHALDTFLLRKNTDKVIETYTWLGKAYEDKGQLDKSILYFNESLSWKDTLLNEKSLKWVSEMQMKYEFGKKEKEIEHLQEKARQEKIIWGGTILGLLLLSVLLYYSIKIKNVNLKQKNIILEKEQNLANLELSKNQLEQEKLKQKLEMKNRELASKAIHLLNKNEILTNVTSLLNKLNVQNETQNAALVKNAKNTISLNINLDQQWEDFKVHFEEVHTGFFSRMLLAYPSLSPTDLRLSAYLLINLSNKEIAQISNISADAVRKRKQRLREKLNLSKDQDIRIVLNQYDVA